MTQWHARSDHRPIAAEPHMKKGSLTQINITDSKMWGLARRTQPQIAWPTGGQTGVLHARRSARPRRVRHRRARSHARRAIVRQQGRSREPGANGARSVECRGPRTQRRFALHSQGRTQMRARKSLGRASDEPQGAIGDVFSHIASRSVGRERRSGARRELATWGGGGGVKDGEGRWEREREREKRIGGRILCMPLSLGSTA